MTNIMIRDRDLTALEGAGNGVVVNLLDASDHLTSHVRCNEQDCDERGKARAWFARGLEATTLEEAKNYIRVGLQHHDRAAYYDALDNEHAALFALPAVERAKDEGRRVACLAVECLRCNRPGAGGAAS